MKTSLPVVPLRLPSGSICQLHCVVRCSSGPYLGFCSLPADDCRKFLGSRVGTLGGSNPQPPIILHLSEKGPVDVPQRAYKTLRRIDWGVCGDIQ